MDPQAGANPADFLIGQLIGNYLVTQKLGEGGMGSVYLAEHPSIGKKVAVKVLHNEFSANPDVADRFFTEAKSIAAMEHPNIVQIIDYGVIQAGPTGKERLVYFTMEYLAGLTLSQLIQTQSPIAPERALTIALQVADALSAAHRIGIVHRDLKPDNIILVQRGRDSDFVKILDFGIAKLTGDSASGSARTRTGLILGTPAYMSPEQCEGSNRVDHRTDIYALGICLYEMLVGRVPFQGDGYSQILIQHMTAQPIPPSQYRMMSPHVEAVVMKALEKRPENRYPTMDEFTRAMADPVGYVEAHGGLAGFMQKQLMPSNAPIPPIRHTPAPLTPVPGMLSPYYGQPGATPTTLGAAAGQASGGQQKSKTGLIIAGVVVVAAAAAGVLFVISHNGKKAAAGPGSGSGDVVQMPDPGSNGSAIAQNGSNTGSATVPQNGSNGSAAVALGSNGSAETGSATITPPPLPTTTKIVVTSKPPGAEILLNGKPTGMLTDSTVEVEKSLGKATITLRLKNYDDATREVALDRDQIDEAIPLKKKRGGGGTPPHGQGSNGNAGHGSNAGQGSATQHCDTCLEKPEDL